MGRVGLAQRDFAVRARRDSLHKGCARDTRCEAAKLGAKLRLRLDHDQLETGPTCGERICQRCPLPAPLAI
eukprot:3380574-Prymnesium_polylepis.1